MTVATGFAALCAALSFALIVIAWRLRCRAAREREAAFAIDRLIARIQAARGGPYRGCVSADTKGRPFQVPRARVR